jgi:hypothetical protein
MRKLTSEIKAKDIIILDCGYGCDSNDTNCKVLQVEEVSSLFDKTQKFISFFVEIQDYTKERFYTVNFKSTDLIDVFSVYVPKKI